MRAALAACDAIGAGVDFARVDLLLTDGGSRGGLGAGGSLALCDVSLYPAGGAPRISPRSVDAELSAAWCAGGGPVWSNWSSALLTGKISPHSLDHPIPV